MSGWKQGKLDNNRITHEIFMVWSYVAVDQNRNRCIAVGVSVRAGQRKGSKLN